jgi:hypothetical protein
MLGLAIMLGGSVVACSAPSDAGDECKTDDDCKGARVCEAGECVNPDKDDPSGSGSGATSGDPDPQPTLAERAVGSWYTEGTAQTQDGPVTVRIGWFLCPDQRMYGFSEFNGFGFLDKGTYIPDEAASRVDLTYLSKDVELGDVYGPDSLPMTYDAGTDQMTFPNGVFLWRVEGTVTNADCDPAW